MRYRVLGPVEVRDGDVSLPLGGYRQRLVLAILLSRRGSVVGTDWLVDAVWGEHPPRTARKTLQAYLARLRRVVGDEAIEHIGAGYRLEASDEDVDVVEFERRAQSGRRRLDTAPSKAVDELAAALAMWRGPPFGEMADEPALLAECARLDELRLAAIEDRVLAEQRLGHRPGLTAELETLLAEHPERSRLRAALMLALYRSGRAGASLALYEQVRKESAETLGADPDPLLVALHSRILRQDPDLDAPSTSGGDSGADVMVRNPYKGLHAFGEEDADDFYGRDALVAELMRHLADRTLVVVVGPSGSGKSSVVRAGLVPRLRAQGWAVLSMTPGAHPFESLRLAATPEADDVAWHTDDLDALRTLQGCGGDRPALLLVDQLEELMTLTAPSARRRFAANLVAVADDPEGRCAVVATLRADFLDHVLADPALGEHVARSLVPVGPLAAAELMHAAAQPARDVGCAVEPELLAQLVADMAESPGALPLLEFALTELFDHHEGRTLTLAQYRRMGGLQAAVGRRAEQTFAALEPAQQDAARAAFLRLLSVAESGAVTRRRVERDDVESVDPGVPAVLDAFDRSRLLTLDRDPSSGRPAVELAHECLVSAWPRLAAWVRESFDDLRLGRLLAQETGSWEASGRDDGYLIRESRLAGYEDWPRTPAVRPTESEREFLTRSRQAREQQRRARRRSARRLRGLVAVTTVVALVASGLAVVAVDRAATARAAASTAHARDLASASRAVLSRDPDLSVLLAAEAVRAGGETVPEAVSALHLAVARDQLLLEVPQAYDVALLPGGRALVGGEAPRVIDIASGETVATLPTAGRVLVVAADAEGDRAATASGRDAQTIETWDLGGDPVEPMMTRHGADRTTGFGFAAGTDLLASVSEPTGGGLVVADAETGAVAARRVVIGSRPESTGGARVALADGGDVAYVAHGDVLGMLDVGTGQWRADSTVPSHVHDVAALGDGRVLTSHSDGRVHLRTPDGEVVDSVVAGSGAATALAADASGRVAAGSADGTVTVWAVEDRGLARQARVVASEEPLEDVALGETAVATIDATWTAKVFTIDRVSELGVVEGGGPVEVSPDGRMTAVALDADAGGPAVALHRASSDEVVTVAAPPDATEVLGLAWSEDASRLTVVYGFETYAVSLPHAVVHVVDAATGDVVAQVRDPRPLRGDPREAGTLGAFAVCDGGSVGTVVDTSRLDDGPLRSYFDSSGAIVSLPHDSEGCGVSADLASSGDRYAITSTLEFAGTTVFDAATGVPVVRVDHQPGERTTVRFSPGGGRLLTAGRDGTARVWDAESGEPRLTMAANAGTVEDVAWSADASRIVTGHRDGNARVWSADDGRLIAEVGDYSSAPHVAINPAGTRLLTSADGTLHTWTLDTNELLRLAADRVARPLTPTECQRYDIADCR